jgi:DNA-binding NarL/FixJ family response regulator
MSESRKIRILVVDDHPFLREGIVGAINSQSDMVLVGEAGNARKPWKNSACFALT